MIYHLHSIRYIYTDAYPSLHVEGTLFVPHNNIGNKESKVTTTTLPGNKECTVTSTHPFCIRNKECTNIGDKQCVQKVSVFIVRISVFMAACYQECIKGKEHTTLNYWKIERAAFELGLWCHIIHVHCLWHTYTLAKFRRRWYWYIHFVHVPAIAYL